MDYSFNQGINREIKLRISLDIKIFMKSRYNLFINDIIKKKLINISTNWIFFKSIESLTFCPGILLIDNMICE